MKKHLFNAFIILGCYGLFACSDSDDNEAVTTDTTAASGVNTDTSGTATQSSAPPDSITVKFITKAASGGMMEVQLGNIAQEQGQNQRVKDFGAMMVRDHGKANDELKSIASGKNVAIPDSLMPEHKHHVADLKKRKGAAFDKAYMNMMVQDHQKDIQEFENASNNLSDGEVKAFATRTLPTLKAHLDSATAINKGKKQ